MLRLIASLVVLLALAGCGVLWPRPGPPADVPLFKLPPSALPGGMAARQRLTFTHAGRSETVEALVEVDADAVRVVIHVQNQVALRMRWDGTTLEQTRSDWLPSQLSAERVLSDLQLVFWPIDALSATLPSGWSLGGHQGRRTLVRLDEIVARIEQPARDQWLLHQHRHRYQLKIDSVPVSP